MRRALMAAVMVLCGVTSPATGLAQKPADLAVTVSYKGKGTVDPQHEILVFLFTNPTITAESEPIGMQPITKNGGTATFKAVAPETVYVVMVYDEQSNYDGTSGPPPAGAPIGNYAKDGKLIPVNPAKTPAIKATFDDSHRWGK
jgi:hypothetical protein